MNSKALPVTAWLMALTLPFMQMSGRGGTLSLSKPHRQTALKQSLMQKTGNSEVMLPTALMARLKNPWLMPLELPLMQLSGAGWEQLPTSLTCWSHRSSSCLSHCYANDLLNTM